MSKAFDISMKTPRTKLLLSNPSCESQVQHLLGNENKKARKIQCFELRIFSFNSYVYCLTGDFIASTRAFILICQLMLLVSQPVLLILQLVLLVFQLFYLNLQLLDLNS